MQPRNIVKGYSTSTKWQGVDVVEPFDAETEATFKLMREALNDFRTQQLDNKPEGSEAEEDMDEVPSDYDINDVERTADRNEDEGKLRKLEWDTERQAD